MQALEELLKTLKSADTRTTSLQLNILKDLAQEKDGDIFLRVLNENRALLFPPQRGAYRFLCLDW